MKELAKKKIDRFSLVKINLIATRCIVFFTSCRRSAKEYSDGKRSKTVLRTSLSQISEYAMSSGQCVNTSVSVLLASVGMLLLRFGTFCAKLYIHLRLNRQKTRIISPPKQIHFILYTFFLNKKKLTLNEDPEQKAQVLILEVPSWQNVNDIHLSKFYCF